MLSYDQFKEGRKKINKESTKEKYKQYKRKWALANASESDTEEEEEEEEEEEDSRPNKKGGIDQFAKAMAGMRAEKGVKHLQAAQENELANAAANRREVFSKYFSLLTS